MTVNDHPELARLQDYLDNTASDEFSDLRLHLAQCSQCRTMVEGLMGLQHISSSHPSTKDGLSEQQHQQIADYIDGRLSDTEHQQQKTFIQSNAAAMKAALHYASHAAAMNKAGLKPVEESPFAPVSMADRKRPQTDLLNRLKALLRFQAPVWLTVPATAALVALLSVNLFDQPLSEKPLYSIASYQDNAVIQFRPKDHLPGIGFFAKSAQLSEAYGAIKVSVTGKSQFNLQWPPVSGALNYTVRLQMFDQGNKIVVGEVTTEKNSATIPAQQDDIFHRYEWVLSGETRDKRVFFASGGFVINQFDKGALR